MTIDIEQEAKRHARIVIAPIQAGYRGLCDVRTGTIYIADNPTPTQYRCVPAHEVSHAKHRDRGGHVDRYAEQRADMEAARMLISQADYVAAEILYGGDECAIARELNVMPWAIKAYRQWLHGSVVV